MPVNYGSMEFKKIRNSPTKTWERKQERDDKIQQNIEAGIKSFAIVYKGRIGIEVNTLWAANAIMGILKRDSFGNENSYEVKCLL